MSYFKAKMHKIRFRLWLCPRPNWGSLQHSPKPLSWMLGGLVLREWRGGRTGGGKGGRRGEERGGKGKEEPYWHFFPLLQALNYITRRHQSMSSSSTSIFLFTWLTICSWLRYISTICTTSNNHLVTFVIILHATHLQLSSVKYMYALEKPGVQFTNYLIYNNLTITLR